VFNFEAGATRRAINLSAESEPDIHRTTQMFGTILENVVLDQDTRRPRFSDGSVNGEHAPLLSAALHPELRAERSRGHPEEHRLPCGGFVRRAASPRPTLARAAMYYFLSGYTAKLAVRSAG
jgi:phosphoenolpyruvate carboxykinase (ATP)